MSAIPGVISDFIRYFNPRTKRGRIHLIILGLVLVLVARFGLFRNDTEVPELTTATRTVLVGSITDFSDASNFSLVGTVKAIDQARIQTEASGRVTFVSVSLGDTVVAGQVIAQLENASQQAALIQAEGAYEAAQAAAAQSDVGVESAASGLVNAQNSAITAYRNAYTAVSSVVYNNIDTIFADPEGAIPGVRIDGGSQTAYLNNTRVNLQTALPAWQAKTTTITNNDLPIALSGAAADVRATLALVDIVIERLTVNSEDYIGTEFATLRATLITDRSTLSGTLASIDSAGTTLEQAEDALVQANLRGTNSDLSAANASVKQALGSLRAAQANYAKTIIRTPIAGVVNTLEVDTGDFVGQQAPVATVANNNALEITTFVGEKDRTRISLGQEVLIDDTIEGAITAIAPAVNPDTRKIEVKIQTESEAVANGDTVKITVLTETEAEAESITNDEIANTPLLVPLTAVKFTATDGSMFIVADNRLVARPVTLGAISGSFVEITSGIDRETVFVIDARGLSDGQEVEAITE